jgi:hypothetical protein
MGARGLDFQTWDSVDTRLARELGIEVSHVSESRHGAPNILSISDRLSVNAHCASHPQPQFGREIPVAMPVFEESSWREFLQAEYNVVIPILVLRLAQGQILAGREPNQKPPAYALGERE